MANNIERQRFGHLPDGNDVDAVVLRNADGLSAKILTYGATLTALEVPDRNGRSRNVVLGFETLDDYRQARGHLGGVIGRYANRLRNGRFTLDGREVQVS
ncbi:MAG TPA: galactose-1-epimerase, partial [Vineibacter sp.]|nr:galactose-1-epimerase [Vineibacter sp.]